MSEKLYFQIFYGDGEIAQGPDGVDLSAFSAVIRGIARPRDRTYRGLLEWIFRMFSLDAQSVRLRVRAVVSRAQDFFYGELVPINATSAWRSYVGYAVERGWPLMLLVDWYQVPPSVSDVRDVGVDITEEGRTDTQQGDDEAGEVGGGDGIEGGDEPAVEARGVADEGEEVEHIVELMEEEDRADEEAPDGECSDEEDNTPEVPVPGAWTNYNFEDLTMNEGNRDAWEYHENEVAQGAIYKDKEAVMDAVKYWSMSLRRQFRVVKSSKKDYDVKCVVDSCPWRVHAYKGKWMDYWKCSIVTEHNCQLEEAEQEHRNLSSTWVANVFYGQIVDNPHLQPRSIITAVEERFQYKIRYGKAWRAKRTALQMRFGTYEASYENIPHLLRAISSRNPGTVIDLAEFPADGACAGKWVLQRAFFALGACINAFRHCRPVICMDGTFLTGKYKGQILTAIAVDANNQVLPVALAFVEGENTDSWYWFLERVKMAVVLDRPDVCVIHDRHAGLLRAIVDMQQGSDVVGAAKWPDLKSRWCMRHMGANFFRQFRNKELMNMFKRLCKENQRRKFDSLWRTLDELTKKQSLNPRDGASSSRNPMVYHEQGDDPTALCALPTDAPNIRRRAGTSIKSFTDWIRHEPLEKWSLLHDKGGSRYGIMTTNLAEIYNWVMKGARCLLLVGIVEGVLLGTQRYFVERYKASVACMSDNRLSYSTVVSAYMANKTRKAQTHRLTPESGVERRYHVHCGDRGRRGAHRERTSHLCILRAADCECSCQKPRLLHLPCSHVIAAAAETHQSCRPYISHYYYKQSVLNTWHNEVYGYRVDGSFTAAPLQGIDGYRTSEC